MSFSHLLLWVLAKWHVVVYVAVADLECLDSRLLVWFNTKPQGKMVPSWGPSTCVVLDHLKDGGEEEDGMCFTHACLRGVRGEAFLLERQVSGNYFKVVSQ